MTKNTEFPSFTRALRVDDLTDEPLSVSLKAEDADLSAIAEQLSIPGVKALSGQASLTRHRSLIEVQGHVSALLVRECVASLEEMDERIEEEFLVSFTTDRSEGALPDEIEADLDAPEYLETDSLDLGAVFLEQVVLAMSAHPRKDGAQPITDPGAGATISPFSVLKDLKPDTE